ncbi:uncharacterized protein NECHADRAFT_84191 [Fusarium vanettenii 77-13-4]|uniref:C3H1-type domain-containing protein n=1 Tax=Fusarium vanettenii (strain ATCC MYA-4622 / CBS 123669 / FGSC 9596 / NRRL 45880 / 77-13-4) TaxID=660122 RepID=C7YZZ0_FUSV7|nr:uncharacterized protein NECHADRAFT_84191 [Fusarium vanettenii 77-13-4]EEU42696.1 hypothetical protein NECHADRAFT_84191 [Fusarium vanettenii 77-13-4]
MATPESLGRLKDVWESCKAQDDQKAALIEELFKTIENQSRRLEISNSLLDQAQKEKWELIHKQLSVPFQGRPINKTQFLDEFVRQGTAGGKRAAQALKEAIKAQWPAYSRRAIITHIYANMRGLGATYEGNGVVSSLLDWYAFVSGFNIVDPMFDYLDAGSGKECADYKIKTVFQHHFDNVHCRRIILGASADNGYARLLGKYAGDKDSQERIALIEGPSFARELKEIADQFETCSFVNVFASQTLHKPSFPRISLPTIQPIPDNGFRPQKRRRSTSPIEASPILRNKNGDRVDPPLPVFSNEAYQQVRGWKLCNNFYLLGKCAAPGTCIHDHEKVLTSDQKDALRSICRGLPCRNGLKCDDPHCIAGHSCRYPVCVRPDCRFPPEMHGVDTKAVSQPNEYDFRTNWPPAWN